MKKSYIQPLIIVATCGSDVLFTISGVNGKLDKMMEGEFDIGYGGVDEDGGMDPSSNFWGNNDWDSF